MTWSMAFLWTLFGICLALGIDLLLKSFRPRLQEPPTPCPYCSNPDRLDNGNAISGRLSGNCQFDTAANGGADAPCVCDHWWVSRYGEAA